MIEIRDIIIIACLATSAVCVGLLADIIPKHIQWNRENRRR